MQANSRNRNSSNTLAYTTIVLAFIILAALSYLVISTDKKNTILIFNIVLPVVATWVGVTLAFHFGRESFELTNNTIVDMMQHVTKDKSNKDDVETLMRTRNNMIYLQIPKGKTEKNLTLIELKSKLKGDATRLPIIDFDGHPKYMIHESSIDSYLSSGNGKETNTLEQFIIDQSNVGTKFCNNDGFVIVTEDTPLKSAKRKLDQSATCQDIFVTKDGTANEPLLGWISNGRLAKSIAL